MLDITSVSKTYVRGDLRLAVLRDISLSLPQGSFSALVEKSGSGKSTLLHLIAGLDTVEQGSIAMDGRELTALNLEQLSLFRLEHVGIVFQFFNLLPTLTLAQNIAIPGHLLGTSASTVRARVTECLDAVGLAAHADRRPHQVSGGEMQRAAIARALFNRPKLILADEPTGNLDSQNAETVFELFVTLVRKENATLLVATHDMSLAERADRSYTLINGSVARE